MRESGRTRPAGGAVRQARVRRVRPGARRRRACERASGGRSGAAVNASQRANNVAVRAAQRSAGPAAPRAARPRIAHRDRAAVCPARREAAAPTEAAERHRSRRRQKEVRAAAALLQTASQGTPEAARPPADRRSWATACAAARWRRREAARVRKRPHQQKQATPRGRDAASRRAVSACADARWAHPYAGGAWPRMCAGPGPLTSDGRAAGVRSCSAAPARSDTRWRRRAPVAPQATPARCGAAAGALGEAF
jgi:hypothetical protein